MNTANLQLEGLLVAMAQLTRQIAEAGVLPRESIRHALDAAETAILADEQRRAQLSDSQIEAMLFPVRYLATALSPASAGRGFSDTAADIGRAKPAGADRTA